MTVGGRWPGHRVALSGISNFKQWLYYEFAFRIFGTRAGSGGLGGEERRTVIYIPNSQKGTCTFFNDVLKYGWRTLVRRTGLKTRRRPPARRLCTIAEN